jgi:hypothetical protein
VLQRYMDAHERADLAALLAEDARCSMPPHPTGYQGSEAIMTAIQKGFVPEFGRGDWCPPGPTDSRRHFGCGDVLWLDGLPLRALHNPGRELAVLTAVSRCPGQSTDGFLADSPSQWQPGRS